MAELSAVTARRLTRTQRNLYWGLLAGDYRLKRWRDGKWSVEFLTDGYPVGGGVSVDPRTVKALMRAGWIDLEGCPIAHEVGVSGDV